MKILKHLAALLLLIPRSAGEPKESAVLAKAHHYTNAFLALGLILTVGGAQAGNWSTPTTIIQTGAWGPWFGVVVTDTGAATGCSGSGTKAIDISTASPTSKAQMALLLIAQATNKSVQLYYDYCTGGTSVITNVQIIP